MNSCDNTVNDNMFSTLNPNMQAFLRFAYFGKIESDADISKACVNRAYLEMARKIPYLYSFTDLDKKTKMKIRNCLFLVRRISRMKLINA